MLTRQVLTCVRVRVRVYCQSKSLPPARLHLNNTSRERIQPFSPSPPPFHLLLSSQQSLLLPPAEGFIVRPRQYQITSNGLHPKNLHLSLPPSLFSVSERISVCVYIYIYNSIKNEVTPRPLWNQFHVTEKSDKLKTCHLFDPETKSWLV